MTSGNLIQDKSFQFAIRVVKLYQFLSNTKKEFVMSKQLLRCGTSIGANVSEALRGVSRRDFGNKMAIALKEAHESEYWLRLLHATDYLSNKQFVSLHRDCIELNKILTAIVRKTLSNA